MRYVTVKGIETDIGYQQKDWTTFALKELIDNAYDWLNTYHPAKKPEDKELRKIGIRIWVTGDSNNKWFTHIAVRNSNIDNKPVFPNLNETFDFDKWHSTKRYQHMMTCGSLGDALKRCLGMGYALWTNDYNPDETFEDKQYNEHMIIRRNASESRVFIKVDTSIPDILPEVKHLDNPTRDIGSDTEVEVTLPILDGEFCYLDKLKHYYQNSKIAKKRITFDFYCAESGIEGHEIEVKCAEVSK